MNTVDLMRAVAAVIESHKDDLGLAGVSYPVINTVPRSPWLMVREAPAPPSATSKERAGLQIVQPSIDLVVLVASDPKRPGEAARLDHLKEPLLDLFDANCYGGDINLAFAGISEPLDGSVDRIWHDAKTRRAVLNWGETPYCHALIITMDAQFKRKAQLP